MKREDFDSYAEIKYILISPYKLRKVSDVIRNTNAVSALKVLRNMPQRGARILYKALHSAISNGVNNRDLNGDSLVVDTICIDEGTRHKRFTPRARGRSFSIIKRSSHIKIGLKVSKAGETNGTKN